MRLTRRRFLLAATAAALLPSARPVRWEWRGSALGGEARIVIEAPHDQAQAAIATVRDEIERLERVFSLHRPDSELSRLNAEGALVAPSAELRDGLSAALRWRHLTAGAFDPAVQPLWTRWAGGGGDLDRALERVRKARIDLTPERVHLSEGTALTLNGIAQGTITDRVARLLGRLGFAPPLIDTGEMRLADGLRRTIVLPDAGLRLVLAGVALATSAPGALVFDPAGRHHHLFDPRNGTSPRWWRSVTVIAPTAEMADALSTAFAVLPPDAVGDLAATLDDVAVIAVGTGDQARLYGNRRLIGQGDA